MKVQFASVGCPDNPVDKIIKMASVPRVGDKIQFGNHDEEIEYRIKTVVWYPEDETFDVYILVTR